MIIDELIKVGLHPQEAKIYSVLLEQGDSSATQLAKRTGIGRTNVYDYAAALNKKGLVSEYEKNSKIVYTAENPEQFSDLVEKNLREAKEISSTINQIMPKLQELYQANTTKPVMKFFFGKKAYKSVCEQIYLHNDGSEIYMIIPSLDDFALPEPQYRNALIRKNIFTNLITNAGENLSEYTKRDQRELRKTHLLAVNDFYISQTMILAEDKIYFGQFDKENFAVTMLRQKELVKSFSSLINSLLKHNTSHIL